MKIVSKGGSLHSAEFYKKKKAKRRLQFLFGFLLLITVLGAPIYLSRNARFLISTTEITGNKVTKEEEIQNVVSKDLSGFYFWLIPKANILFYPRATIEKDLVFSIPRIKSLSLALGSSNTLSVQVEERLPADLYCQDISNLSSPTGCYFLDESGFIFAEAPAFSGNVYLIFNESPALDNPLGKSLLDPNKFQALTTFIKNLSEIKVNPVAMKVSADEYDLVLLNKGLIMWQPSADLSTTRSNLESFLADQRTTDKNFLNKISYIDLRLGNKIYYKFK